MTEPVIHTLDLQFQGAREAIAAFLVLGPAGPVLVESGPGSCLGVLQAELARFGLKPADISDVLLTHIHLDHGGAAGWWAQQGARIHVHPLGAPHLVDPSKLLASAQRIYGDRMQSLWGEYLPSPAEKVHSLTAGEVVAAGGLEFQVHDTPGHARHHVVYQLGDLAFVGDLAGIRLSARPHTRLPTPPPEFEREAWHASVARMRALGLRRLYLTHFGPVETAAAQWDTIDRLIDLYADSVGADLAAGLDREAVVARFTEREQQRLAADQLSAADQAAYASVGPMGMSVDGLIRYWTKRPESRA